MKDYRKRPHLPIFFTLGALEFG